MSRADSTLYSRRPSERNLSSSSSSESDQDSLSENERQAINIELTESAPVHRPPASTERIQLPRGAKRKAQESIENGYLKEKVWLETQEVLQAAKGKRMRMLSDRRNLGQRGKRREGSGGTKGKKVVRDRQFPRWRTAGDVEVANVGGGKEELRVEENLRDNVEDEIHRVEKDDFEFEIRENDDRWYLEAVRILEKEHQENDGGHLGRDTTQTAGKGHFYSSSNSKSDLSSVGAEQGFDDEQDDGVADEDQDERDVQAGCHIRDEGGGRSEDKDGASEAGTKQLEGTGEAENNKTRTEREEKEKEEEESEDPDREVNDDETPCVSDVASSNTDLTKDDSTSDDKEDSQARSPSSPTRQPSQSPSDNSFRTEVQHEPQEEFCIICLEEIRTIKHTSLENGLDPILGIWHCQSCRAVFCVDCSLSLVTSSLTIDGERTLKRNARCPACRARWRAFDISDQARLYSSKIY